MAAVEDQQHQEQEQQHQEEELEEAVSGGVGVGRSGILTPSLPLGRVKKIMKLDRDIKKVNAEALLLVALAADLFLGSLAERARDAALAKKRRTIKPDHIRSAVRAHPPTSDFLLDCLPQMPAAAAPAPVAKSRSAPAAKPLPPGARRIEDFFSKPSAAPS